MTTTPARLSAAAALALALAWGLPAEANTAAQAPTVAPPAELAASPSALGLRGRSTMTFLGMSIYEARLWTPPGFELARYAQYPFALELEYKRSLSGKRIAESSLSEMKRQPAFTAERADDWLARMARLFPDVKAGDRITGLHLPGVGARFAVNGQWTGEVADPAFSPLFFGIWLSPQTSEPALRCALAVCP